MRQTIAFLRFINIILTTFIWGILSITILQFIPRKYMPLLNRAWAKMTLASCGVRIELIGEFKPFIEKNRMVVSNHISWLDVPVLQTAYYTRFIGKAEMKKWPLIGAMVKAGGTIFIDRNKKRQLIHINQIVKEELSNGSSIGLFPEGRTGDGSQVMQFKAPILEAAILAKSKITPVVLEYTDSNENRTTKVTYAGEISLYKSVINTLSLKRIHVKIHSLPEIDADQFASRDELSAYLFTQIKNKYENTSAPQTKYDDYVEYESVPNYGE